MKRAVEISFIIPCYNCENSIRSLLASIAEQDLNETYEIICIDDGSSDNTPQIIESFACDNKGIPFRLIKQPNLGPGSARNAGMAQCSGKYLLFVDADDRIERDYAKTLFEGVKESDFCFSSYKKVIDGVGTTVVKSKSCHLSPNDVFTGFFRNDLHISLWNSIFKSDIVKRNNLFFKDNCYSGEDVLFIAEYILLSKTINYVDHPCYIYYFDSCRSKNRSRKYIESVKDSIYWPLYEKIKGTNTECSRVLLNGKIAVSSMLNLIYYASSFETYEKFKINLVKMKEFELSARRAKGRYIKASVFIKLKMCLCLLRVSPRLFYTIAKKGA